MCCIRPYVSRVYFRHSTQCGVLSKTILIDMRTRAIQPGDVYHTLCRCQSTCAGTGARRNAVLCDTWNSITNDTERYSILFLNHVTPYGSDDSLFSIKPYIGLLSPSFLLLFVAHLFFHVFLSLPIPVYPLDVHFSSMLITSWFSIIFIIYLTN